MASEQTGVLDPIFHRGVFAYLVFHTPVGTQLASSILSRDIGDVSEADFQKILRLLAAQPELSRELTKRLEAVEQAFYGEARKTGDLDYGRLPALASRELRWDTASGSGKLHFLPALAMEEAGEDESPSFTADMARAAQAFDPEPTASPGPSPRAALPEHFRDPATEREFLFVRATQALRNLKVSGDQLIKSAASRAKSAPDSDSMAEVYLWDLDQGLAVIQQIARQVPLTDKYKATRARLRGLIDQALQLNEQMRLRAASAWGNFESMDFDPRGNAMRPMERQNQALRELRLTSAQ